MQQRTSHLITSSFQRNYYIMPKDRISFFKVADFLNSDLQFFKSQYKLCCLFTFSRRVPNKRLMLSRFALVRYLNQVLIGPLGR